MLFEDYFLRQIAQLAAVIAKVTGLSKAGQFQEAYKMIDHAIEELFGLDAGIVKQMDDSSLIGSLTTTNGMDSGKFFALANLIEAEGDVLAAEKRSDESQQSYQRALNIYLELSAHSSATLEKELSVKINELQKKLTIPS